MVCILDADKEGFLRSDTSLIQTIGRSARHANAEVVLYADKITNSMKRAHRRDAAAASDAATKIQCRSRNYSRDDQESDSAVESKKKSRRTLSPVGLSGATKPPTTGRNT